MFLAPIASQEKQDISEQQLEQLERNSRDYSPSINQLVCYGLFSALSIDLLFPQFPNGIKPVFPVTFHQSPNLPVQQRTLFCDISFKVQGQEISCHKSHVANISPFFVNLLSNGMKEKDANCIELKDISLQAFQKIISLQYNEPILLTDFDELLDLLTVSNQFQCSQMQSVCLRLLCDFVVFSSKHQFICAWDLSQSLVLQELEEHLLKIFLLFWKSHNIFERYFTDTYNQILNKIKPFLKRWCSLFTPIVTQ